MGADVTQQLADAVRMRAAWSPHEARRKAAELVHAIPDAWVDWDEDSGEEWVRVLVDRFVVALIRVKTPLVIVARGELKHLRHCGNNAATVVVDDMDTPWLSATPESIRLAFPEREVSPTLDAAAFSAMDLWFATT